MTAWKDLCTAQAPPDMEQIDQYVSSPLWLELQEHLRETYGVPPRLAYSRCSLEPGWNVKYQKGGRALCTVYPRSGYVTVMISIGPKDEAAAQGLLLTCTQATRDLYRRTAASKLGRWLMLDLTAPEILEDIKALLTLRTGKH